MILFLDVESEAGPSAYSLSYVTDACEPEDDNTCTDHRVSPVRCYLCYEHLLLFPYSLLLLCLTASPHFLSVFVHCKDSDKKNILKNLFDHRIMATFPQMFPYEDRVCEMLTLLTLLPETP